MPTKRVKRVNKKKAIAYIRVSTDTQEQELGAEAQRDAITAWALREGVEVVRWHVEEVSGGAGLQDRPLFTLAIAECREERIGWLVVQKLDRWSRDPLTHALAERELADCGASLAVAEGAGQGDDPMAQLMRNVLVAFGAFERAMIAARTKAALAVKRKRGEYCGGETPLGMRRVGDRVEPNPEEASAVEFARALRASGVPLRKISKLLALRGMLNRKGKPYATTQVVAMVA